uniref:RRM domain-containing protein n=1 Tax=Oryza rufipogon TaxID=4529 RepID=A0A0E0Q3U0_ORYRU
MGIPESARLSVGGVSPDMGDTELRDHFGRYGDVADIWLRRDRLTGLPRRFAFAGSCTPPTPPSPSPTITTSSTARSNYEESEYINNIRRFGVMKGNMLTFHCVVDYISQDGKDIYVSIIVNNRSDVKSVNGNISSTRFVGKNSTKFCRYCQRVVTPSNCDGMVHTDACLIYQESFVHYPNYGVTIGHSWYPIGGFIW